MNGKTAASQRTTSILVADDDMLVRRVVERALAGPGRTIRCVGSGEAVLEAARESPPDVIILDVIMPGLGGREACRILRSEFETRNIPVIMLTGLCAVADEVESFEHGADDYVVKPFVTADLEARVKAILRRSQQWRPA